MGYKIKGSSLLRAWFRTTKGVDVDPGASFRWIGFETRNFCLSGSEIFETLRSTDKTYSIFFLSNGARGKSVSWGELRSDGKWLNI